MYDSVESDRPAQEAERNVLQTHPRDGEGNYLCYRECEDGTPCLRLVHVPWMACRSHLGDSPLSPEQTT